MKKANVQHLLSAHNSLGKTKSQEYTGETEGVYGTLNYG